MKKSVLSTILGLALCFNLPCMAFAQEPAMPDLTGKSNEEAAVLVDGYNAKVDEYNQLIDKDYDQAVQAYNDTLAYNEEAKKHNAQEDAAVAQANAANAAEQARVDAANAELRANYEKDLASYNSKVGNASQSAETSKYKVITSGRETYYYDDVGNLLYKSVAGDTAKDDIVTYENVGTAEKPVWSNTYGYKGINKRYVNFSIISVIGKTTTGTDWDNDASKYSNKAYATIANLNDVSSMPLNVKDPGEGRNLINYMTEVNGQVIGLELCDSIIRSLATTALDTYFNKANGSEAAGNAKMQISFADFPSTSAVFKNLQENGSVFIDPETGQEITGADINARNYTLMWFSVKYQTNGWRVSGVLLKNGVIPVPEEPEYLVANLISYSPHYLALKEAVAPIKGAYLSSAVFNPVAQEGSATQDNTATQGGPVTRGADGAVAIAAQQASQNDAGIAGGQAVAAQPQAPAGEVIADDETPLASGVSSEATSGSWALLNLVLMVLTILLLIRFSRNKKEEEEEEETEKRYRKNIPGVVFALVSVVVFFLTENIFLPMVIVDQWTLLMGAFAIGGIASKIISRKKVEEQQS